MAAALTIELFVGFLLAATAVAIVAKLAKLPYTLALVVAGLGIALVFRPSTPFVIDRDVVFHFLLPPLLFEGALAIDLAHLRRVGVPVAVLAIAGVLIAMGVIGGALAYLAAVPLLVALLIGAMISPTDPVSVIALFRDLGVPRGLRTLVESESLANDGTGVVLFTIVVATFAGGETTLSGAAAAFAWRAFGGVGVGLLLGFAAYFVHLKVEDRVIEPVLTLVLAFGTDLVAERIGVSGIVAVASAGLIIGNFGARYGMTAPTRANLLAFWEVLAFASNSFIFLLIGVEVSAVREPLRFVVPAAVGIGATLFARAVTVYPLTFALRATPARLERGWMHVVALAGLRGGIPVALSLSLPESVPNHDLVITVVFAIVLFTLLVQGPVMAPLVRHLGLAGPRDEPSEVVKPTDRA
ncbi:MAG: cation:proton antiporter [Thermoplasmatota archaeon]